jgi:hypothetical protein
MGVEVVGEVIAASLEYVPYPIMPNAWKRTVKCSTKKSGELFGELRWWLLESS